MAKRMLVLVIVFMMAGILPVMAEVEDGAPPWFSNNGDYSTWVGERSVGPPSWAASRTRPNWKMSSVIRSESDDEDDLGYPPWAPLHARENYKRSLLNDEENDEDEDEGNGPSWFLDEGAVKEWNASEQQGPPPWARVRGKKKNRIKTMSTASVIL